MRNKCFFPRRLFASLARLTPCLHVLLVVAAFAGSLWPLHAPTVKGMAHGGRVLQTQGWPSSTPNMVMPGDVFTINGVYAFNARTQHATGVLQHFIVSAPVRTNALGEADIRIWPPLTEAALAKQVAAFPQSGAAIRVIASEKPHWGAGAWLGFALMAVVACAAVLGLMSLKSSPAFFQGVWQRISWCERISATAYLACSASIFLMVAAFLSHYLFGGLPHISDTMVQYMQSKIFAAGRWYEASHSLPRFFDFQNAVNNVKYYSIAFPGHALFLALGQLMAMPWVINPLMGALTLVFTSLLAKELAGRSALFIAPPLVLLSPFVLFMSSEYMSHATSGCFLTLFLYAYIKQDKKEACACAYAMLAGMALGVAFITRPYTTVFFALPVGLHALYRLMQRRRWLCLFAMMGGFAVFVVVLGFYQHMTTGSFWHSGYQRLGYTSTLLKPMSDWGFAWRDIVKIIMQVQMLQVQLFGWPIPSLFFVFLLFLLRLYTPYCLLLFSCGAGLLLAFIGQNYYDFLFGARFLYEAAPVLIVLTTVCLVQLGDYLPKVMAPSVTPATIKGGLIVGVAALFMAALPSQHYALMQKYKHNYWEGDVAYYQRLDGAVQKPALVFVKPYADYKKVFFTQPPREENAIIFALDRGKHENEALQALYPQRYIYAVDRQGIELLSQPAH